MDNRERLAYAVLPLTTASTLFGVFPIRLEIFEKKSAHFSIVRLIFGFIVCFLLAGFSLYGFFYRENFANLNYIFKFAAIAFPFLYISNSLFYLCRAKTFATFLDEIFEYSNMIQTDKFYTATFWIVTAEVAISFFVLITYNIVFYAFSKDGFSDWYQIFKRLTEFAANYSIILVCIQQANLLMFLYKIFVRLNGDLKSLEQRNVATPKQEDMDFLDLPKINTNRMLKSMDEKVDFIALVNLYNKVCDTCDSLNTIFGGSASANATHILIQLAITIFFVVVAQANLIFSALWIIAIAMEQWFLCFSCELVINEVIFFFN